jgi:probable rRNA maturation factor
LSGGLVIKRARSLPVDVKVLRQITRKLLEQLLSLQHFELGIHLVRAPEMARINETFLHHAGPTDVITFDYSDSVGDDVRSLKLKSNPKPPHAGSCKCLTGELFVCHDVALSQAKEFHTSWQSEIVRYVVHGILHLQGFDDHAPADRRKMKREENRLLRALCRRFPISKLAQPRRSA